VNLPWGPIARFGDGNSLQDDFKIEFRRIGTAVKKHLQSTSGRNLLYST
jgi:hypothetical protein